jgi:TonB family protein
VPIHAKQPLLRTGCICFWAIFTVVTINNAVAQCKPPKYQEGIDYADSRLKIVMSISMSIEDFAPERLICLADALKQRYHDRKEITFLLFSSLKAALNYSPPISVFDPVVDAAEAQMHGAYFYDENERTNYVEIYPRGGKGGINLNSFSTRIDLPVTTKPQCRLQINSRCLLALKDIEYPREAEKARITGTVTLTGRIGRNGKMAGVKIAETNITPIDGENLLANAALENIKTWQFEKSEHNDPFRITYSYAIDIPAGRAGQLELRPELPNIMHISLIPFKPDPPR